MATGEMPASSGRPMSLSVRTGGYSLKDKCLSASKVGDGDGLLFALSSCSRMMGLNLKLWPGAGRTSISGILMVVVVWLCLAVSVSCLLSLSLSLRGEIRAVRAFCACSNRADCTASMPNLDAFPPFRQNDKQANARPTSPHFLHVVYADTGTRTDTSFIVFMSISGNFRLSYQSISQSMAIIPIFMGSPGPEPTTRLEDLRDFVPKRKANPPAFRGSYWFSHFRGGWRMDFPAIHHSSR